MLAISVPNLFVEILFVVLKKIQKIEKFNIFRRKNIINIKMADL
jgi:hypothetical protein